MAEQKKSFVLYSDLLHTVSKMPDDKAGLLFKHILSYVNDENPVIDDLLIQLVFEPVKQQLKRDLLKWGEVKEKRSKAGLASANKRQHMSTHVKSVEQNQHMSTVSVNDNVNVNVINKGEGEQKINEMLVPEMVKIYVSENKGYFEDKQNDFRACLDIAHKIAKIYKWDDREILTTKKNNVLKDWKEKVDFIKRDSFLQKLPLSSLNNQFQSIILKMQPINNSPSQMVQPRIVL